MNLNNIYDLGILGGMGPKATNAAFSRIIDYTLAKYDQEHINIIILNHSSIPDRTNAILKNEQQIIELLKQDFEILQYLNVPIIISICNTSHYHIRQMQKPEGILFIDSIEETFRYLKATYKDKKYCILGTTGFVISDVFDKKANSKQILYPMDTDQDVIMEIINAVKAGTEIEKLLPDLKDIMNNILQYSNNIVFVLACTELSLFRDLLLGQYICVDCMDVALTQAIFKSGYKINEKPKMFLNNIDYFKVMNGCLI